VFIWQKPEPKNTLLLMYHGNCDTENRLAPKKQCCSASKVETILR